MDINFTEAMESIISAVRTAGYDPYDQVYAYLITGNETYITRSGNARALIAMLDYNQLWDYVQEHKDRM